LFKGIDLLHQGKYLESIDQFAIVTNILPDHPVGYFFYAAAIEWLMIDYRNFERQKEYIKGIEKAIHISEKRVKTHPKSAWSYFYRGASYGFRGIYYMDFGNIVKGFLDGMKGYKDMRRAIAIDSQLYDAYYAFGMFHYWRSHYARSMTWLPFVANEKDEGISQIQTAVKKGIYVGIEAASSLIRIYHNEGVYENSRKNHTAAGQNFSNAIYTAQRILADYPNYLYCYWYLAECYSELTLYDNAADTLQWVLRYFEARPQAGPIGLLEVKYKIGLIYFKKKDYQSSYHYLHAVAQSTVDINEQLVKLENYPRKARELLKNKNFSPYGPR